MRRFAPYLLLPAVVAGLMVPGLRARHLAAQFPELKTDGARMLAEATDLCDRFGPRPYGQGFTMESGGHDAAIRHLEARFRTLGLLPLGNRDASNYRWYAQGPSGMPELVNLVGFRPGTNRSPAFRLISAHYDSVKAGCGAEDDASGVALVLEIAQATRTQPPEDGVVFALFDGEEPALLGSRAFAQHLDTFPLGRPSSMVSVEMAGWRGGSPNLHTFRYRDSSTQQLRSAPPELVSSLRIWAAAAGAPLHWGDPVLQRFYPALVGMVRSPFGSDDGPFTEQGIPALMLATSSFTRFYPDYHLASDKPGQLSAEVISQSAASLGGWILHGEAPGLGAVNESHRLRPWLLLLGGALPIAFTWRRRRPLRVATVGAVALAAYLASGALAAPVVAPLGLWLWPATWNLSRGRRMILLTLAGLPLLAMAAILAAVVARYGVHGFDRDSALPLGGLLLTAISLIAMYARGTAQAATGALAAGAPSAAPAR